MSRLNPSEPLQHVAFEIRKFHVPKKRSSSEMHGSFGPEHKNGQRHEQSGDGNPSPPGSEQSQQKKARTDKQHLHADTTTGEASERGITSKIDEHEKKHEWWLESHSPLENEKGSASAGINSMGNSMANSMGNPMANSMGNPTIEKSAMDRKLGEKVTMDRTLGSDVKIGPGESVNPEMAVNSPSAKNVGSSAAANRRISVDSDPEDDDGDVDMSDETKPAAGAPIDCFATQIKKFVLSEPNAIDLWFPTELEPHEILGRRLRIKQMVVEQRETERRSPLRQEGDRSAASAAGLAAGLVAKGGGCAMQAFVGTRVDSRFNDALDLQDLNYVLAGYDEFWMESALTEHLDQQKTKLHIRFSEPSDKLPKGVAGMCRSEGDRVTILIHPGINDLNWSSKTGTHTEECNGILCYDRLDCLMSCLEHELVHMMMHTFYRAMKVGHGKPFQLLARGLFGHTLYTHALGYGKGMERVLKQQDKDVKFKRCQKRDLVAYATDGAQSRVMFGMILSKTKESVSLMHENGSVCEKVPFWNLSLMDPSDYLETKQTMQSGSRSVASAATSISASMSASASLFAGANDGPPSSNAFVYSGPPPKASQWYQMLHWTNRFLQNKESCVEKQTYIQYATTTDASSRSVVRRGLITAKKSVYVAVAVSENVSCNVPYHCFLIDHQTAAMQ